MTSIEISSVNLPGLVAWRTALDIRQVVWNTVFSRSLVISRRSEPINTNSGNGVNYL